MGGFIASSCEGEGCKGKREKEKGKALCIRNFDKKEVCPTCLINGPDFDRNGVIKS